MWSVMRYEPRDLAGRVNVFWDQDIFACCFGVLNGKRGLD